MLRGTFRCEADRFFSPSGAFQNSSASRLSAAAVCRSAANRCSFAVSASTCAAIGNSSPRVLAETTIGSLAPHASGTATNVASIDIDTPLAASRQASASPWR
ncbi:hypothetical protein D3C73_1397480 [compost metagenome]